MNYNFNSQFAFPWNSGPYMPNGFPGGSNNGNLQHGPPAVPSGTQSAFSITQPGGVFSGILPSVRYPGGMYPFGMNGSFSNNTFPANWNFSYNADVNQFNQLQSQPPQQPQCQTSGTALPQIMNKNPLQNGQSTVETEKPKETKVAEEIAEKVSSLLQSDPNILKSALSKLQLNNSPEVVKTSERVPAKISSVPFSTTSIQDGSETDSSVDIEQDTTSTTTDTLSDDTLKGSDNDVR